MPIYANLCQYMTIKNNRNRIIIHLFWIYNNLSKNICKNGFETYFTIVLKYLRNPLKIFMKIDSNNIFDVQYLVYKIGARWFLVIFLLGIFC